MSPPPPPPPAELTNDALAEANITVEAVTDTTSATTARSITKDGIAGNGVTNTISDPTLTAASESTSKSTSESKWKPLTVQGVAERRLRAGKMVAGVAAPTNIPLYKGYYAGDGEDVGYKAKPLARRWDRMLPLLLYIALATSVRGLC